MRTLEDGTPRTLEDGTIRLLEGENLVFGTQANEADSASSGVVSSLGTFGVFNVAKGKVAALAALPAANDGLVAVLLQSAGLQSLATLTDYQTLAAILASNSECTFTSYARQTCSAVTSVVDYTNDWVDVDCADLVWTVGSSQAVGMLVICYDPDVSTGTDADLVPLVMDDGVALIPPLGTLTCRVALSGFFRAA